VDDRLIKLEEALAHLERHVEELDGVVQRLYARVDAIRTDVERLRGETKQQFDWLAKSDEPSPGDGG
jgi:uncharacterized coiled-coil protein SlyX